VGTYLFGEVTFRLGAGDRVGLVGRTDWESTMLKCVKILLLLRCNSQERSSHGISCQDIDFEQGRTVLEGTMKLLQRLKLSKKAGRNQSLVSYKTIMKVTNTVKLSKIYDYTHRFELLGGYNYVGDTENFIRFRF
jgi:ATP-binding cassette subfamily F protein 3